MRAQFEIMGLAIIVIIISIASFFFIAYSFEPEGEDATDIFQEEQFSQNILDAILKTSLHNCRGTVADLLSWELTDSYPSSAPAGSTCDESEDGFERVLFTIGKTIQEYNNRQYLLQIRKLTDPSPNIPCNDPRDDLFQSSQPVVYCEGTCDINAFDRGRPGKQTISLYPYQTEPAELVLWICTPQ